MEARGEPDAGTIGDIFVMRVEAARRRRRRHRRRAARHARHPHASACPCTTSRRTPRRWGGAHAARAPGADRLRRGHHLPGRHPRRRWRGRRRAAGGTRRGDRGRLGEAGDRGGVGARTCRRGRQHRSARSPSRRSAAPSSRRGSPPARAEGGTIGGSERDASSRSANSVHHVNPIPTASRVGPLLISSIIPARTPGQDDIPEDRRGADREPLPPRRRDARGGRGRLGAHRQDDVLRPRPEARDIGQRTWVEHFPDADSRPRVTRSSSPGAHDSDVRLHRLHRRLTSPVGGGT